MMQIWVDADACPVAIKEILYRVAERLQLQVTLVANQLMRVPASRFIRAVQVPSGADVADAEIVRLLAPGDLVVTGDIPLASDVLTKGGFALNPRGEFYTPDNIAQMLTCANSWMNCAAAGSIRADRRRSGRQTVRVLPTPWTATWRAMPSAIQFDSDYLAVARRHRTFLRARRPAIADVTISANARTWAPPYSRVR